MKLRKRGRRKGVPDGWNGNDKKGRRPCLVWAGVRRLPHDVQSLRPSHVLWLPDVSLWRARERS